MSLLCNCHVCDTHLPKITTYPRYVKKERTVVRSRPDIKPDVVVFGGPCPKCKCYTWSQAFKPESYKIGAKWR